MKTWFATLALAAVIVIYGPRLELDAGAGTHGLYPLHQAQVAPSRRPTVNLTAEQRHIIKEIVLKDYNLSPAAKRMELSIGDQRPQSVQALPVPVEISEKVPEIRSHSFFVMENQVVLVDPSNRISDIIE